MSRASDSGSPPGRGNRRAPGRPARLSHDMILEAAKTIPFDELSFTTVAAALNVSREALYKYFKNVDGLRAALATKLGGEQVFEGQWETWKTDSGSIASLLTEIALNFRTWVEENEHNPSLFRLEYGALRFAHGGHSSVLLERMEDFLTAASDYNVPPDQAMMLWQITGDVMTTTGSIGTPANFEREFRSDLAQFLSESDKEFPALETYLKTEPNPARPHTYDITLRALVLGLAVLYGLGNTDPRQGE